MNKKLTTILLAVLILLIGKVDAATLTQKVGEGFIQSTVEEGREVTIKFVSTKYTFSNWVVESGNVNIDTTNPIATFTMPNSNVIIRANYEGATENYTVTLNPNGGSFITEDLMVGDYITYVPSNTEYIVYGDDSGNYISDSEYEEAEINGEEITADQTYNPSQTTLWKIFSINGNTIEIISAESIGNLTLGGATGYGNAVQVLQDLSAAYLNTDYAESARHLGYSEEGLTSTEITNYKTITGDEGKYNENGDIEYTFPYIDTQYTSDLNVLENNTSLQISDYVWLSSRVHDGGEEDDGCVRIVSGCTIGKEVVDDYFNSPESKSTSGVRPIIRLKSSVGISSGSGGASDPYILSSVNTKTITVTTESKYETLPTPTKNGYTFLGWSTSSTATNATYTSGKIALSENTTLYAVWAETYTITYNANGGSGTMNPQTVSEGSSVTLATNTFTRSGYTFIGWSTSSSATTATYTEGQTITPTASMTLYAVWKTNITCECCGTTITSGSYCSICLSYSKCGNCGDCEYHWIFCDICGNCESGCCTCEDLVCSGYEEGVNEDCDGPVTVVCETHNVYGCTSHDVVCEQCLECECCGELKPCGECENISVCSICGVGYNCDIHTDNCGH